MFDFSRLMMIVGSVSNLTRKQLDEFKLSRSSLIIEADAEKLIYEIICEEEINRVSKAFLDGMYSYNTIGLTTTRRYYFLTKSF